VDGPLIVQRLGIGLARCALRRRDRLRFEDRCTPWWKLQEADPAGSIDWSPRLRLVPVLPEPPSDPPPLRRSWNSYGSGESVTLAIPVPTGMAFLSSTAPFLIPASGTQAIQADADQKA